MEAKLKMVIGEQMFAIASLQTQLEQKDAEIAALKVKIDILSKAGSSTVEAA